MTRYIVQPYTTVKRTLKNHNRASNTNTLKVSPDHKTLDFYPMSHLEDAHDFFGEERAGIGRLWHAHSGVVG